MASEFQVQDMTCGHCVATITKAVQAADPAAQLAIDLPAHRVKVESNMLSDAAVQALIEEAGFSPQPA